MDLARLLALTGVVRSVVLIQGEPGNAVGLAAAFAEFLHKFRHTEGLLPPVPITSPSPPRIDTNRFVRAPHLVTISTEQGQADDLVVWEIMTWRDASAWLEREVPADISDVEQMIPDILHLRQAMRSQRALHDDAQQLALLLGERYLSIRFVLQHYDSFKEWVRNGARV